MEPTQKQTHPPGNSSLPVNPGDLTALRLHLMRRNNQGEPGMAGWHAEYLPLVERILREIGLNETECKPLGEIAEMLRRNAEEPGTQGLEARWDTEYAQATAEISYMILIGVEETEAAQRGARRLLARNIPLPAHGGDARGWKRLLEYRDHIRHGQVPDSVATTYREHLARLKADRSPPPA